MDEPVKIIECPRDAWQGLTALIAAEAKAGYLRKLIEAGFTHIDAVSFVSPAAVPQMADSERVLELLRPPKDVEIIGIVVNERGAERAVRSGGVRTLGFPYSISAEFLRRNQHETPEEALAVLRAVVGMARGAGMGVVAYISMAFGNPYGEAWSTEAVKDACDALLECGVGEVSLADTVGAATPTQIEETVGAALAAYEGVEIGVHLHARRDEAAVRIGAAYAAGCRRFDGALGGWGGCPFAQDALVGNIPTEILLDELRKRGATLPELGSIEELVQASGEMARGAAAAAR